MSSYRSISRNSLLALSLALAALVVPPSSARAQNLDPALGETAAGDLVADAVRAAAKAEIALVQAGVLKAAGLPQDMSAATGLESVLLAYPQERIAVMTLEGSVVLAALERGLSVLPVPHKGFLQVSGVTATYDPAAAPMKRVVSPTAAGVPLDPARRYKVAVPLSLAQGYLGFFRVFNNKPRQALDTTLAQALSAHLATNPPVPKPPERLRPKATR